VRERGRGESQRREESIVEEEDGSASWGGMFK